MKNKFLLSFPFLLSFLLIIPSCYYKEDNIDKDPNKDKQEENDPPVDNKSLLNIEDTTRAVYISNEETTITTESYINNRLIYLFLPISVISIEESAFYNCNYLKYIFYYGSYEDYKKIDISFDNEEVFFNNKYIYFYSDAYIDDSYNHWCKIDNNIYIWNKN